MNLQARILGGLVLLAMALALGFATVAGYEWWAQRKVDDGKVLGRAEIQAKWDADRAHAQALQAEQARQNAAETLRRLNKQQENQHAQDALMARMRRDRDAAVAAVDGLQIRAAAYLDAAGCGTLAGDPALECVRQAAAKVADALGRCAAVAQRVAADADDARARGLKCEADYDALTR